MPERSLEAFDFKVPKPQTILIFIVPLILFIVSWGSFAIVPAGHRGLLSNHLLISGFPKVVKTPNIQIENSIALGIRIYRQDT